jgi:hypothetical protein
MVQILLVRSMAEIHTATKAASEFLVYRRLLSQPEQDDGVLAIWVKSDLDAGLPTCLPPNHGLGIYESFSLAGIWTLCWIDGTLMLGARSSAERRDAILCTLVQAQLSSRASSEPSGFFPVFDSNESVEVIKAEVRSLRAKYPQHIGRRWYRDDKQRGIVAAERSRGLPSQR